MIEVVICKNNKPHSATTKAKVAIEALQGYYTARELARKYQAEPTEVTQWKEKLLKEAKKLFTEKSDQHQQIPQIQQARLYEEIGRLKMEVDWLKKTLNCSKKQKKNYNF